jgi:hypothetical protein
VGGAAYMLPMSVDLGPNTLPSQYHPLAPRGVVVSWATVPALFSLLHPRHSHLAATTARKRRLDCLVSLFYEGGWRIRDD